MGTLHFEVRKFFDANLDSIYAKRVYDLIIEESRQGTLRIPSPSFQEILERIGKGWAIVAFVETELIGCVFTIPYLSWGTEIASLVVDPKFRGQGVGRMLLAEATWEAHLVRPLVFAIVRNEVKDLFFSSGYKRVPEEELKYYEVVRIAPERFTAHKLLMVYSPRLAVQP